MLPSYLAPVPATVEALPPGCLMGVFILAALLLWTSGFGGTSGFFAGCGFALPAPAAAPAGFFAPFSASSVRRASELTGSLGCGTAAGAGVGTVAGVAGVAGVGAGAGLGAAATGVCDTCCGAATFATFSFSTDGDFFLRNSGFGGGSGFFEAGGVLGFGGAALAGVVFGGDGALAVVFGGELRAVCVFSGVALAGAVCDLALAGAGAVFGAGFGADFGEEAAPAAATSGVFGMGTGADWLSCDFATETGSAEEAKSPPGPFFGPVALVPLFSSSDTLFLGVRRLFFLFFGSGFGVEGFSCAGADPF